MKDCHYALNLSHNLFPSNLLHDLVGNVDLLSFLEMLAACLYLPCLPQTCLCFPRLVPASLPLSLPCHVFRMVFTGVSVVSRVPLLSLESLSCPQSSLSSEFLVLRVPCPQSSLSSEFFVLEVLQRSFARLPPVFLELSLCSPMTSSFHHSFAAVRGVRPAYSLIL